MSIPVDLARLGDVLGDYGAGYLLTASPEGRVKAVTVHPYAAHGHLVVPSPSRGTSANLAGNDKVTIIWAPLQAKGYTLIVDGTAAEASDGLGFLVTPQTAVLHRPADHADGPPPPDGCGHDCRPV
ncbi:MAG TPA: hypothetical protein P5181_06265 [Dermatophilaceae bacterium]|nr:hypothetical protein [Dermatophilaceae bacterium]